MGVDEHRTELRYKPALQRIANARFYRDGYFAGTPPRCRVQLVVFNHILYDTAVTVAVSRKKIILTGRDR